MTSGPEDGWPARGHPVPLAHQLAAGFEAAIRDGHLRPGARLPSTRDLSRRFGVHRSTAGAAYARLRRRGLVAVAPGSRPCVSERSCPCAAGAHDATTAAPGGPGRGDEEARRIVGAALGAACRAGIPREAVVSAFRTLGAERSTAASAPAIRLFEPRRGLRASLAAELEARLQVRIRPVGRATGSLDATPVLARREVLDRLERRATGSAGRGTSGGPLRRLRGEWLPLSLAGGTRERGLVRRGVRSGLVVLLSPSRTVHRYAAELAAREFARGVSFTALAPDQSARVIRATAAARLVLFDAASRGRVPPARARCEPVALLPDGQIRTLRSYLDAWRGT